MGEKLKSKSLVTRVGDVYRSAASSVFPMPLKIMLLATNGINRAAVSSDSEVLRNIAAGATGIINLPSALSNRVNATITSVLPEWTEEKADNPVNTWTIDKGNHLARYYDSTGKLIIASPVGTGLISGDKSKEGDNKSPDGTYRLSGPENGADKKGGTSSFGKYFYRTNHRNKSGSSSGVGIHGTENPLFNGMNISHGCFRVDNRAIEKFHDIAPNNGGGSKIIIYEKKGGMIPKFLNPSLPLNYHYYLDDPEFMARMAARHGIAPGMNTNSNEEQNSRQTILRKTKNENTRTDRRTSDLRARSERQERNQQHDKVVNAVADALHGVGEGFMFAASPYVGGAYMLANGANRMLQGQYDWRTGMDLGFGLMPFGNQISRGFQYASEAIPEVVRRMPYTIQMQRMPWAGGLKAGPMPDKMPVIVKKPVLSEVMQQKGWIVAEDGTIINPKLPDKKFVLEPETGRIISLESYQNVIDARKNFEKSKAAVKAAKKSAKSLSAKEQQMVDELENQNIHGFSLDEWKAFRDGFKTTEKDILAYKKQLPEYYSLAKSLQESGDLVLNNKKWLGNIEGLMVEVDPMLYIKSRSKHFIDNGWKFDGLDRGTAMFPKTAKEIEKNGGLGASNWTTTNKQQTNLFSEQRDNGPVLRGIVSNRTNPDRIIEVKHAHDAANEKYSGITDFDGPVEAAGMGSSKIKGEKGIWRLFGPDMYVKSIAGNNGLFDRNFKNPLGMLIPPMIGGYYINNSINNN